MTRTVDLTVTGGLKIHCAGCEQRIGTALRSLSGVQEVQASAQSQRVKVTMDTAQVSVDQVRSKLEELGYAVRP